MFYNNEIIINDRCLSLPYGQSCYPACKAIYNKVVEYADSLKLWNAYIHSEQPGILCITIHEMANSSRKTLLLDAEETTWRLGDLNALEIKLTKTCYSYFFKQNFNL